MEPALFSPPGGKLKSVDVTIKCAVVPGTREEGVWKATFNDRIYSGRDKKSVLDAISKGKYETIEVDFAKLGERVQALAAEQSAAIVEMIRLFELKNEIYKQASEQQAAAATALDDQFANVAIDPPTDTIA